MKHNRDEAEAEAAHAIAEERFKAGDLAGAKTWAFKSLSLFPSLPGLEHTIAALDVHLAARNTHPSNNWRAILGVDAAADLDAIKKRYKKLCILTHPDKNRSAAATGAFNLVRQAWAALSAWLPDAAGAGSRANLSGGNPCVLVCYYCRVMFVAYKEQSTVQCPFCRIWMSSAWYRFNQPFDQDPILPDMPSKASSSRRPAKRRRCSSGRPMFECPNPCPHCGERYSSMVAPGPWLLRCTSCGRQARINVRPLAIKDSEGGGDEDLPEDGERSQAESGGGGGGVECPKCGRQCEYMDVCGQSAFRCRGEGSKVHFFVLRK